MAASSGSPGFVQAGGGSKVSSSLQKHYNLLTSSSPCIELAPALHAALCACVRMPRPSDWPLLSDGCRVYKLWLYRGARCEAN